jgi:hypothetical protein
MNLSPAEGDFWDERGISLIPAVSTRLEENLTAFHQEMNMVMGEKSILYLSFPYLYITVLNSFIPVTSCDTKLAHRIFGLG